MHGKEFKKLSLWEYWKYYREMMETKNERSHQVRYEARNSQRKQVYDLYLRGYPKTTIARITGVPRTTVRDWIDKWRTRAV